MKKLFVFFCLCAWGIGTTNGQEVVRDYTAAAAGQSVIYHGKEQVKYANSIKNHPYLKGEEYVTGDLSFEGIRYRGVKMRLDLYRNELLLLSPDNRFHIVLPSDRVDYAEFHGYHIFYRYPDGRLDNLPEGYYLRLHEGSVPYWRNGRASCLRRSRICGLRNLSANP